MVLFTLTAALAAPPSSSLGGEDGSLTWDVVSSEAEVTLEGRSPKWTVSHTAKADFSPVRTQRTDADGQTLTIDYSAAGATLVKDGKTVELSQPGLWDGDTLDVRLGYLVSVGKPEQTFHAVDSGSAKVYRFDSQNVGAERCGTEACTHVLVQLAGMLRWVGPSFHYWFAADGELLKFEGPAGTFVKGN